MTYEELIEIVKQAEKEDWQYNDRLGTYTYKHDLDIRLVHRRDDDVVYDWEVVPDWAKVNHHPGLVEQQFDIFYRNSFVETFSLGKIDEFRALLPIPYPGTSEVTYEDYRLARQLNEARYLDAYLHQAGLTVKGVGAKK